MSKILTFGVFDYFHLGHLRLFKQCKAHADYLIVAIQDSEFILKYKPDAKVLYNNDERREMIESINIVDEVIIYDSNRENVETLKYQNNTVVSDVYSMTIDLVDFKTVLDGCSDQYVTLNFGDGKAMVLLRGNIRNVIPQCVTIDRK